MIGPLLRRAALLSACSLTFGTAAVAHEFWLEPSAFAVAPGGRVGVYLCNGNGFEGWSLPRDPRRIEEFVVAGPDGARAVVGLDGSDPAGVIRVVEPGGYVVAYRSNRAISVLPGTRFDEHLQEKGLGDILALRTARGHDRPVRESFSRHAKALLRVGGTRAVDRVLGLPLELVAEPDRPLDPPGGMRTFQLLHRGKPLAGALVTAARPGTSDADIAARTDANGRVGFRLHEPGPWRISAVHMTEAPASVAADWDSLWASLTFELSSRRGAARSASRPSRDTHCRNRVFDPGAQAQR